MLAGAWPLRTLAPSFAAAPAMVSQDLCGNVSAVVGVGRSVEAVHGYLLPEFEPSRLTMVRDSRHVLVVWRCSISHDRLHPFRDDRRDLKQIWLPQCTPPDLSRSITNRTEAATFSHFSLQTPTFAEAVPCVECHGRIPPRRTMIYITSMMFEARFGKHNATSKSVRPSPSSFPKLGTSHAHPLR
jgi:hypothetical protein